MAIVLKYYCEYFYYDMSNKTEFERYQTYTKFDEYHELADGFTYLLFSHNLLLLKWGKDLGKGYKDMVLSLYLTLLGNKLFLKYKKTQDTANDPDVDECPLRFVMFCTRKDFRENARQMIKHLRRTLIGNKLKSPSAEISSCFGLNDIQPEIVDEFRVKRLILYIQEAINVSLDNQPQKGALMIERTLQIIGENMEQTIGNNSLLLPMLVSCISPCLVHELQNISNQYLSYNRTSSVQSRIDIANNVEHFKKIQYELKTLYNIIIPISISLTYRAEELLIKKGSDDLRTAKPTTGSLRKKVKKQSQHSSNSKDERKGESGKKHNSKSSQSVEDKSTKTNENADIFSLQQCFEQHREALVKIRLPGTLELKVSSLHNQKLVFLIDRIRHLKEIFNEDEFKVKSWWTQKETERENAIYLMARRFYEEMDTRAAVEMLFYDCSCILKRRDFEDLWIKINCLFTGLNMRDLIPQGNPALEAVGVLLGNQDMPSELMQKSLELVDDLDALEALFNMWKTLKPIKEEEFIDTIDNTTDCTLVPLAKQITNCERWKSYLRLLSFS